MNTLADVAKSSLRTFYNQFKDAAQNDLKRQTLCFLEKDSDFFIKTEYLLYFGCLDFDKLLNTTEAHQDWYFLPYFIGYDFQEKITCDVVNVLKELKYFLKHEIPDEEVFELRDK